MPLPLLHGFRVGHPVQDGRRVRAKATNATGEGGRSAAGQVREGAEAEGG